MPTHSPRVAGLSAKAVIGLLSVSTTRLCRFDTTVAYTRPSSPPDHTVLSASSVASAQTLSPSIGQIVCTQRCCPTSQSLTVPSLPPARQRDIPSAQSHTFSSSAGRRKNARRVHARSACTPERHMRPAGSSLIARTLSVWPRSPATSWFDLASKTLIMPSLAPETIVELAIARL